MFKGVCPVLAGVSRKRVKVACQKAAIRWS